MKKIIFLLVFFILFFSVSNVFAADKKEIEDLMYFIVSQKPPQQGLYGSAMWILGVKGLSLNDNSVEGYRNIFFRVHDGGNRMIVTILYKTIVQISEDAIAVETIKFQDGGSILGDDNKLGELDGRPDKITIEHCWEATPNNPGGRTPEKPIQLTPELLKIWEESIKQIEEVNELSYGSDKETRKVGSKI